MNTSEKKFIFRAILVILVIPLLYILISDIITERKVWLIVPDFRYSVNRTDGYVTSIFTGEVYYQEYTPSHNGPRDGWDSRNSKFYPGRYNYKKLENLTIKSFEILGDNEIGFEYAKDNNTIYYCGYAVETDLDIDFKSLEYREYKYTDFMDKEYETVEGWFQDKNYVYATWIDSAFIDSISKIDNIDVQTFKPLGYDFYSDKNGYYYSYGKEKNMKYINVPTEFFNSSPKKASTDYEGEFISGGNKWEYNEKTEAFQKVDKFRSESPEELKQIEELEKCFE